MASVNTLKVRVADLIDRIEKRQKQTQSDYEKSLVKYNRDLAAWQVRVVDVLEKALTNAKAGKMPTFSYGGSLQMNAPSPPTKPSEPKGWDYQNDIDTLKMSVDEVLTVTTTSRFSQYL